MTDLQTWTLLQRDGSIWFDDEKADKTIYLRIVQDLTEAHRVFSKDLEDCRGMALFHLLGPERHYLVASYAMEKDTDSMTLQRLITKQFEGICEVLPYRSVAWRTDRLGQGANSLNCQLFALSSGISEKISSARTGSDRQADAMNL